MKNRLGLAGFLLVIIVLFMAGHVLAQKERPIQPFMRQKLVYAQGVLEGITLEKFDLVITNATRLRDMNMTNVFLFLGNPSYLQRITNFQTAVDNLKVAAKDQNLERSAQAYSQVTESCVDCHQWFRREQSVKRQAALGR